MIFIYQAEANNAQQRKAQQPPAKLADYGGSKSILGRSTTLQLWKLLFKKKTSHITSQLFFTSKISNNQISKTWIGWIFFFDVVSQLSEGFLTLGFSPSIHNHQESSRSSGTPHSSSGPHNTNRITHPKPITIFLSIDSTVRWMEVISYDMVWHDFLTLDYDVFFSLPYKKPHYT